MYVDEEIANGSRPVLVVIHSEDEHRWLFFGDSDRQHADTAVISLGSLLETEPALAEVADLPPGWIAQRASLDAPWSRQMLSESPACFSQLGTLGRCA